MPDELTYPYVLKPRHGAGSQATYRIDDSHIWRLNEITNHDFVVQPFMTGLAASVALLIGPAQQITLPPTEQLLSADGRFHYKGGRLPLPLDLARRAEKLGRQTVAAIPGLRGYVGVDLILGNTDADDYVLEVNPRLTTSYVALRALALDNLMEIMLRVAEGQPVHEPRWRSGGVAFRADGAVLWE
jgi:predicted ATP-grasp superfamily ATP-dependent carboligase